jgi:acyl dehydratase
VVRAILAGDLDLISFDDLPLGGEWTTRRRTISDAEIALFAGLAGDFSPLTIDTTHNGSRLAPPALLVAAAIGLGSMDMPLPSIAEWEWLNWKFPRPVKAGDTIYARWTLTQKRPPVGSAPTAIVVWRVDVHTADGVLCAEGELGASVRRHAAAGRPAAASVPEAQPSAAPASSRRRRRRRSTTNGAKAPNEGSAPVVEAPPVAAAVANATADRAQGSPRRRRRGRRSPGSPPARKGDAASPAAANPDQPPQPAAAAASAPEPANAISRVIRRLRRT